MASVFLNDGFVPRNDARVSAFDAGFQHGVGLFETLLAVRQGEGARVLHLQEHVERMRVSAAALGLSESLRAGALEEALKRAADRAASEHPGAARLRLRLTITGGDLNMLVGGGPAAHTPTLLIVGQPATEYPAEMFARGTLVTLADMRPSPLDPMQGHKTLNYWGRLRELQQAAAKGAGEAMVFSVTNHLVGGCVSNAFVVRDGVLMTPIARGEEEEVARGDDDFDAPPAAGNKGAVLPSPVLPGIVRRWVLDWALGAGLQTRRRMLDLDDVLRADEVFLTNSSWGVLPVVRLEAEAIGAGSPGEITRGLTKAWGELVGAG
ncbi:MAG: hypothetical protein GC200_04850 [Tepidisphaera sp.]|nr:hypothetical protein [Tepidisphaera sp.]